MALNFPNSPALNDVYTDTTSGFSYQWNGTVWISFSAASSSQIKTLDDISGSFNNSTQTFALTSGALSISPPTSQSLIINLGGVIQDPTDDYSVSGSNIVFSTAPTSGLSFSGISLGPGVPVDYANNGNVYTRTTFTATASQTTFTVTGTYTVGYLEVYQNGVRLSSGTDYTATNGTTFVLTTPANLNDEIESIGYKVASIVTTTGQFDNLSISGVSTFVGLATHTGTIFGSNLSLTGVVTATSFVGSGANLTGIANTANIVSTAITTGILNVGTGITINSSGINVTGITTIKNASGTVTIGIGTTALLVEGNARVTGILTVGSASITLDGTNNRINVGTGLTLSSGGINITGVITATSFVGNGSGLTGVGIGTNGNVNTTGNISAGIATFTRLDVPPVPITFSPAIGATSVVPSSNIIITFDQQVYKGTGNITLRANSAGGTAFSTIGVSSSSVSISGGVVTIDPPSIIGTGTTAFVVVDAGAFTGFTTTSVNALINTYSFTTFNFAFSSINPANAATNVGVGTNITLTFNNPPTRGTGTITLRSGSVGAGGSTIETFDADSSGRISISGNDWILDPTSNLGFSTSIHTIIPSTAIVGYVGLNTAGADTHSFTTESQPLGSSYEGGFLICKASPLRWVVSPYSAEVGRTWYLRNDANTTAQSVSGCTGWFVPTISQLQNPGYCCRSFWGPSPCYSPTTYWSSTQDTVNAAGVACYVVFTDGSQNRHYKPATKCVRAFRCVTY